MHPNEKLIQDFYTAFNKRDFKTMGECYAEKATFTDEVFKNLNGQEVRGMWEMLCTNGKELTIKFSDVKASDTEGEAKWVANYLFSATGNKVENRVQAKFKFVNGKIVEHRDYFDFYKWSSQALGIMGKLMGWTSFIRNKIQTTARKNLVAFMGHDE
jgi:ketosteroid isomerase-like protein